jgi:hypothetical protein
MQHPALPDVRQDPACSQGSSAGLQQGSSSTAPRVETTEVQRDLAGAVPMENPVHGPSNDDFTPAPMEDVRDSSQEATVVFVKIEQVTGKT